MGREIQRQERDLIQLGPLGPDDRGGILLFRSGAPPWQIFAKCAKCGGKMGMIGSVASKIGALRCDADASPIHEPGTCEATP